MTTTANSTAEVPAQGVSEVVEHLFRHEAGKMLAILTRIFGLENLCLAEDVIQEALVRALQTWPYYGIPKNPSAWIMKVSRNLALDVVRREQNFRSKEPEIIAWLDPADADREGTPALLEQEIKDDSLRMMFVCCHPLIPAEAQVALALKTLCGFSTREISVAFLATEAAIAKRLTRAEQKIREAKISFEIPAGKELSRRIDGVLQTLYLLFNEGYKASSGDKLVREDLCHEAIRLNLALAEHPVGNRPETHALLALMLFNTARLATRMDIDGNLLLLKEQDRSRWEQGLIARGMFHLAQSASGNAMTQYHLQAGIAACHCSAPDYDRTDWQQILSLYDHLIELDNSPVVALNRAVAVAKVRGAQAGLQAVAEIRNREKLDSYYLLYAVMGEFEAELNDLRAAAGHFQKSLKLAGLKSEQTFLRKRVEECESAERRSASAKVAVASRR